MDDTESEPRPKLLDKDQLGELSAYVLGGAFVAGAFGSMIGLLATFTAVVVVFALFLALIIFVNRIRQRSWDKRHPT